jgi:hypothetical protein
MNIKLDENMPGRLVSVLSSLGHNVETVVQEGMAGHPDGDIWRHAQKEGRFLITQDLDFSNINLFAPGTHHGIMLVRMHRPGRLALTLRVRTLFESENVSKWQGCFVVASDRKLRVRRPVSVKR